MQTSLNDNATIFYDSETGELHGRQADKAKRFVQLGLVRESFPGSYRVLHIPGYNSTDYIVERKGEAMTCNCQFGSQGKTCSHQIAVEMFLQRREAIKNHSPE